MPRFNDVETITFTNAYGKQFSIKDIRPISKQVLSFEMDKKENDLIDEIASRRDVFGDFGELQSWRVFDINIIRLTEANFNLKKIRRIKIPV